MNRRLASAIAVGISPLVMLAAWIASPLPEAMLAPSVAPAITVADRNGIPLRGTRASDGTRARWVSIAELDPDLITAFLAVEDRRFYAHHGVDWRAVARAVRDDLRARRIVSGASTLTMQTARLLAPSDRDVAGKLAQALWALRIERHLTKQQILEQYLNRVHLGQGTVGVAAATALYFDASPADVSVAQAALLAGLAHAPATENPFASLVRARRVRARAITRMRAAGNVGEADAARGLAEPLIARPAGTPFLAPHFTTRVLQWAEDSALATSATSGSGGVLRTSLDLQLQSALEQEVRHTVQVLGGRGVREAATVVLDNRTGEVLAWVGSPDFWADTAGQTDMVVSPRQPGSALKPFVYGLAFDRGFTAATVLPDVAREYQTSVGLYRPRNYDHRFHGPVRVREALGSSYNIPAVETAERIGAGSVLGVLRAAGFASLHRSADYYGLGIALGNGDVTLLELANAYRALGSGGLWRPVRWRPASGPASDPGRRVISARAAAIVLDILGDAEARVPGFGISTPFEFAFPVAVKTGTSRHFTDNWAVAVTGRFTVAVWVGNFNGRAMEGVSGITGAGPLLHRAVLETAKRYPPGAFTAPHEAGDLSVRICRLSGMRAGPDCPTADEWFIPGSEPADECDWHRHGEVTMPAAYTEWLATERGAGTRVVANVAASPAGFRIVSPLDGDRYSVPPSVDARYSTIALRAAGARGAVRWSVDGRPFATARLALVPGPHLIEAEAGGQRREVRITVEQDPGTR
ncbi:MAG TPA: penicillin-binding protein 1C [Gemmatimonadaceae bacterium]|nr:penicillin-binding protein 1C [Gemmatimonadaceae bacterium]